MTEAVFKKDILSELEEIRSRILVMEWDKSRKQLNYSKTVKFEELVKRKKDLMDRLNEIQN